MNNSTLIQLTELKMSTESTACCLRTGPN